VGVLLTWGEKLVARAVGFRAELWALGEDVLAKQIWRQAQSFKGRTFAKVSAQLLVEWSLPEVWELQGWGTPGREASEVVRDYKSKKNKNGTRGTQRKDMEGKSNSGVPGAALSGGYPSAGVGQQHIAHME
jgi:hypothetical protein